MSVCQAQPLLNRKIMIGISGGIAAYKIPELVRRLKDWGADVRCVMTQGGQAFITPLTLQAVSGNPVHHDLLDPNAEAAMGHIELAKWADLVLIAPASANTLAQLAHGHASDLLTTICLATAAPLLVAPAMNQQMWAHAAVQANCDTLRSRGVQIIAPDSGSQACGDVGAGRMPEPLTLRDVIAAALTPVTPVLAGKQVVITAGPTREAIDPVRYLSNHSSGKMGFALAAAAQQLGATVTLVAGPCQLPTPAQVKRIDVISATDMLAAVEQHIDAADIFIGCAAVADYRPRQVGADKIKKQHDQMHIELVKNPDILATVAARKNAPFTIGFAAETQQLEHYATGKLQAKKLALIAANNVSDSSIGFNSDDNAMQLFWHDPAGQIQQRTLEKASKSAIAIAILQHAAGLMAATSSQP
ncbi:bifunctional phosphopantothenoylcysteine decarboxylase/phosphopantothenate--cysteine ligase CoaBC [Pseudidiomarina mangrovi]|uniref:bifunctional phosphopantothenoylcysteine decarboxylase/phosphopantothenate--cysteine ligase CoaBC n=1 Tax=Pseudidiomarina mangrovi TaxID=2487133 RepID=UPI000FC9B329|nr:bifunctional phosphopantothenoylcysteine decarboxylase/phosphopantothenate--cysteine ligase CoaBC [Pseudidiomarina mangrovi]